MVQELQRSIQARELQVARKMLPKPPVGRDITSGLRVLAEKP
ncbi:MAG: hypothetical protein AAF400_02605 [Bacteroidota bacterium]